MRDERDNLQRLYTVSAVDPAGTPWDICTVPAIFALREVERLRAAEPFSRYSKIFWISDPDDPERGDVQMDLEEMMFELEEDGIVDKNWELK